MSIFQQSGEGTSEAGAMETESTESQPSSSSGGAEEGATSSTSTSTITPPTEEMEALYSEMDALNK